MRIELPTRAVLALIVVTAVSGVTFTGCASLPDGEIAVNLADVAEASGYRCVDTVPPADDIVELRTCTTGDDTLYVVKLDSDAPVREHGVLNIGGPDDYIRQSGAWAVVGTVKGDVESVAQKLP